MRSFYFSHPSYVLLKILILFFCYLNSAYASPFFSITTPTKYIEIPVNTIGSVTYQVQNSTKAIAKNIIYDVLNPNNAGVSIDPSGTTCGKTLNPSQACALKLLITAGSTLRTLTLNPRVCTENGIVCSVPDSSNRTVIKIVNSSTPPPPPPLTVIPFILSLDTAIGDQHLQLRALNLQNAGTESATLTSFTITPSANLQTQVGICNASTSCIPPAGSEIACSAGMVVAPGDSCLIWIRSIDSTSNPLGALAGTINVNVQGDHPLTFNQTTFSANFTNDLYVGGFFANAGGVANTQNIAKWNGASWSALSTGINNGNVNALAVYQGDLFIGGAFINLNGVVENTHIVRWNGTTFNPLATGIQGAFPPTTVAALTVFNNTLIVAGNFTNVGGANGDRVVSWNGTAFSSLSTGIPNNQVNAATVYQNELVLGGNFVPAGGFPGSNIVRWNGTTFLPMQAGLPSSANTMIVHNSNLFIGGTFTNVTDPLGDFIIRWDGANFSPLSNIEAPNDIVLSTTIYSGNLVLGGDFSNLGGANGNAVSSYDGVNAYIPTTTGIPNGLVSALAAVQNNLFAGGTFTTVGPPPFITNGIVQWNGSAFIALGTGLGGGSAQAVELLAASSLVLL